MTKVKKEIVEAAALKLVSEIAKTMPSSMHKFLLGSISAVATIGNSLKISELLASMSDENGMIDLDNIKAIADSGFKASEGKIQVELFGANSGLLSMFVKPVTLTITKNDIDKLIAEIEANSIPNVTLPDKPKIELS